jgi:hypothetical protein
VLAASVAPTSMPSRKRHLYHANKKAKQACSACGISCAHINAVSQKASVPCQQRKRRTHAVLAALAAPTLTRDTHNCEVTWALSTHLTCMTPSLDSLSHKLPHHDHDKLRVAVHHAPNAKFHTCKWHTQCLCFSVFSLFLQSAASPRQ